MDHPASTVFARKETIQDSEGEGRHGKEVHGHDDIAVIAQESSPEVAGLLAGIQAPGKIMFLFFDSTLLVSVADRRFPMAA
jgi:hypothetical protein